MRRGGSLCSAPLGAVYRELGKGSMAMSLNHSAGSQAAEVKPPELASYGQTRGTDVVGPAMINESAILDGFVEMIARRTAEILRRDLGLETKRLMSVAEAARYLDRSSHAIRHMIAKGVLPSVRRDNRVFLDREDMDRWIETHKTQKGGIK